MEQNELVILCEKGAKTTEEIQNQFNGDETCSKCSHIKYKNGILSCEYANAN